MIDDPNRLYDGYTSLAGGVDGGRKPNLIEADQGAEANNAIFRQGAPATRPSFLDVTLSFDNPDMAYTAAGIQEADVTNQSLGNFQGGQFQGAAYYSPSAGREYLMVMISGRLYQITPGITQTASVREIALGTRNRSTIPICYMLQADAYFIIQDGESLPIIFDGITARRAVAGEIFTGLMMGYGMGRIVLVGIDGKIYFGDIYDGKGHGGADVLGFTETGFLNEGFPSALPPFMGRPTGVQFIPQQDTATGVGECLVMGERGVESFFLSIPRDQWKNSSFQRTALLGIGVTGHRAFTLINADIGFRAQDGFRSYRQARAEINSWAHIPLSTNVRKWTEADTHDILKYCSAITFDQRVIFTCTPVPNQFGSLTHPLPAPYHNGLLALDFDVLATFGGTTKPAWDGHWGHRLGESEALTGLRVTQLVTGNFDQEQRAFAFILDGTTHNALVEIQRVPHGTDSAGPITAKLTTRSMSFNSEFNEKSLYSADVWIDQVTEPTTGTVAFRADQVPFFTAWDTFTANPISGVVEGEATVTLDGYVPRKMFAKPNEDADELGPPRLLRRGYEFQAELEWSGRATMRKFRAHAQVEVEASGPNV